MMLYLLSVGAGVLVGVVYALLGVRSPAPPVIALIGILGIFVGEQIPPFVEAALKGRLYSSDVVSQRVHPHVFGHLPSGHKPTVPVKEES